MQPELSILIVNWNGGKLLRNCLSSIAKAPPSVSFDIIVVDNASSDDSVAWLRSAEAASLLPDIKVHVIENAENAGFSKANNQAIAHSGASMLLLLNPDTEVTSGAIDTMVACLHSDERIGACGPRLLNTDGSVQPSVWRNPPTAWEIIVSGLGVWRLIPHRLRANLLLGGHWDHATRRDVPMLGGAAILARRKMVDEVGGLDERFHMYGEDNEWCLRISRAGWQLIFDPAASVMHHGGQFSLQRWNSLDKLQVQINSGLQYNRYSLSRSHSIANLLAHCFVSFCQKSWYRLRGRPAEAAQIIFDSHLADLKRILSER